MNWIARAKETFLGAPAQHQAACKQNSSVSVQWDSLPTLQAAINEALTGAPQTHPAARAFSEKADIRRHLIVSDTATGAAELGTILEPLAVNSQATTYDIESDRPAAERFVASNKLAAADYDAAFVSLSADADFDTETLFATLAKVLADSGLLWLDLRPGKEITPGKSAHLRKLLDDMLQLVPSRWRLKNSFDDGTKAPLRPTTSSNTANDMQASFEVISKKSRGGTLLGPLFAAGCIAPEIDDGGEGSKLLRALYSLESELVECGEVNAADCFYVARPRRREPDRLRRIFDKHAGPLPAGAIEGMAGPLPAWLKFNVGSALQSARAADYAAPFPPKELMYHTTGLDQDRDFARHGADILKALSAASPNPLNALEAVLDFGVGVGRVARYFKGFSGRYTGVDIDRANLNWISGHLPWVEAAFTEPAKPLPFEAATFDGVISISVFTHIDRATTDFYIDELHRVTRSGALLFLTLHGEQALRRALADEAVTRLVGVARERLELARTNVAEAGFDFAEQYTHLTREDYRYGTTFLSRAGAEAIFGRRFQVLAFVPGAIHSFQDLIVLARS